MNTKPKNGAQCTTALKDKVVFGATEINNNFNYAIHK